MNPISDAEIWDRYQAGASSREIAAAVWHAKPGQSREIKGTLFVYLICTE